LVFMLTRYTSKPRYLRATAEPGARRINLDGSDAGAVSDHDRKHAQYRLDQLARLKAKKVAMRPSTQPPPRAHPLGVSKLSLKLKA
jgi:sRNA-binding protein